MISTHPFRAAVVAAVVASASPAAAHEILHEVVQGKALAVRLFESDGERVANAPFELFAPGDAAKPWYEGRTDANGWLAFVPGAAGKWRLRVHGDEGHGLDVTLDVDAAGAAAGAATGGVATAAFVLRPVLGVAAIALVFAALVRFYRRQRKA